MTKYYSQLATNADPRLNLSAADYKDGISNRLRKKMKTSSEHCSSCFDGLVIWLTGLSGAGKTTIANALSQELAKVGVSCFVLDGDEIRDGLNSDLGFSAEDRHENVRRIAHVAKLVSSRGHTVIVAAITPSETMRSIARSIVGETFREVFVDTPIMICEKRDPKGLYRRARSGSLKAFTGVSDLYERPDSPDLVLQTDALSIDQETELLLEFIGVKHETNAKGSPLL